MPLPLIALIGISIGITLLTTALSYLLRPHQKKPNSFDSPTYGFQGMVNSYEPGTPLNLPYGTIQVPPAIINWYRRGHGGKTRAHFIGSLGHGQIAGVRGIRLNGLLLRHYYSKFNKDCEIYITHGEYQQKVYKFCKEVRGYIISISGTNPTKTLVVSVTNGRSLQAASAKEPGYLVMYGTGTDTGKETYEVIRYLSSSVAGDGTTWTLKGVRVTKTFSAADNIVQIYKIEKNDLGVVRESIPHIGYVTTYHQEINNIELTTSWSSTFTTNGKVDGFATTFDFPEGLYKFDDKEGYKANQVEIAVRWRAVGASSWVTEGTTRTALTGLEHKIDVTKHKNYAIIVNSSGDIVTGTQEDFDFLDDIEEGMEIEFQGISNGVSTAFTYIIDSAITEATGDYTISGEDGSRIPLYRGKIKFKSRIAPSINSSGKYQGSSVETVSYAIYYYASINTSSAKIKIPESPKTIQSNYQVTYQFPQDGKGNEEKLDSYKQHEMQYKLVSPTTTHNTSKDAHKVVLTSIEDVKMDDIVYPGEALIGMRLLMTEKISGSLDNITAIVDGLLVKDTSEDISGLSQWAALTVHSTLVDGSGQPIRRRALASAKDCQHAYRLIKVGTSGGTEPNWLAVSGAVIFDGTCEWQEDSCKWNDNPLDIICDLQQNKMYGRGQYLDFDNTILNDLYDSYNVDDTNGITDREYINQSITENSKARNRMSININIDFRQPLMDTLEVLAKSTRGYNFWDGQKLLTFIDRYRTPVTMINNAIIVPDSFVINEINVEDKINRIYSSILNRYREYKQDQVGRDYIDEGFAIGDLIMEQIHLYGISDKWHATKILSYMLKYSKYIKHIIAFEQGIDACIYDVGDIFYFSHEAVNNSVQIGTAKKWSSTCGRVIAVSGATFTTDKDVTISNGQKVLLRTDTGTATEYTINSQVGRVITCSTTITNVSINSIYSLGTSDSNNEYYRLFTCIAKKPKEYTYEIIAITYDDNVFKDIYDTATPSQETSGASISIVEENDALNEIDFAKAPPSPISHAIVKEDPLVQGEAIIYITAPIGGNWSHAEIYIKNMESEEWKFAGRTSGNPIRITGLVAGEVYEYEVLSYSIGSIVSDIKIHDTFVYGEDSNAVDLPRPTGFQIANRMGTLGNVYGKTFKFRWDDMTSQTKESLTYAMRKAGYEQIKYYLEIYFSSIPTTVKIGNTNVKDMIARHETIDVNKFNYDYEDTMEDISKIFERYTSHASYSTYYNVPQRTIKAKLYCINNYSKKSLPAELTLTNPAPGMFQSNGTTVITPTLKKLKSGIRVSFTHPYDANADEEYDISHFIIEYAENALFTTNLKKRKVMSSVTVNSVDEEISSALYTEDIKGLDPKKTYYVRVKPYDVFGVGTSSQTASITPGVTDDDEDADIAVPAQVTGVAVTINANNNVVFACNNPSGSDDTDVVKVIFDWRASQFTGVPTLTLTSAGGNIPTLAEVDQGYLNSDNTKLVIGEKKNIEINLDESETHTKNRYIVKGAKVGYTYFVRIRFENSSRKQGAWSAWGYNATAVSGFAEDDMPAKWAMYKFLGSVTATNATQITWVGGTPGIKKKTNAGNTDININTQSTPQTVTGTRFLAYIGTADLAIKTEAQMDADSSFVGIAKLTAAVSGKCKVLMMLSSEHYHISAYEGGFNQLSALTADLGNITAGDLTLDHSSGAFIKLKDSSGNIAIRLRVNNSDSPDLVVMRSGQDADNASDAEDPDKVAFSTKLTINSNAVRPKTPMIVESFNAQINSSTEMPGISSGGGYNANSSNNSAPQVKYFTSTSGTAKRKISADLSISGGYTFPLPYINIVQINANGAVWEVIDVVHDPTNADTTKRIFVRRTVINDSSATYTWPARSDYVAVRLEAETFT